jgi:small subunit ribosomal protein S8
MSVTDPIADFLTVVRNAYRGKHEEVTARASNIIIKIAEILKEERYIKDFRLIDEEGKRSLRIHLRYLKNGRPAVRSISRASTPGLRRYVGAENLPRVLNGLGTAIISTSQGVMTEKSAWKNRVGGEVLCKVY